MPRKSIYTETDASSSRKKKKGADLTGPATIAGVAGLRRVAASGALGRMHDSEIRTMRIRETDAYRRLKVNQGGRQLARIIAADRQIAKTGVGQSSGYKTELKRADLKRVRSWVTESFPKGEPSGQRPIRFSTPGSLKAANAAGGAAIKSGVPRTTPPGGRSGGSSGRGGARVGDGVGRGGAVRIGTRRGFGER